MFTVFNGSNGLVWLTTEQNTVVARCLRGRSVFRRKFVARLTAALSLNIRLAAHTKTVMNLNGVTNDILRVST